MGMYLEGIRVKELLKNIDERGAFTEIIRSDWTDFFKKDHPLQFNYVQNQPEIIRAWHKHNKGQNDYFICIKGSIKICVYDDKAESKTKNNLSEIILSSDKLSIVRVPGHYWHGYKVLGKEPATILYGVNKLYNYTTPDEERRPWDDNTVIPNSINGNVQDSRTGISWNWNYPPHR